jgi:hypothetical protein
MQFGPSMQAAAEQRRELAVLFVQAGLSRNKTAKAINAKRTTIQRDAGPNRPPCVEKAKENNDSKAANGPNGPLISVRRARRPSGRRNAYMPTVPHPRTSTNC